MNVLGLKFIEIDLGWTLFKNKIKYMSKNIKCNILIVK